jgi:hypothetical protein
VDFVEFSDSATYGKMSFFDRDKYPYLVPGTTLVFEKKLPVFLKVVPVTKCSQQFFRRKNEVFGQRFRDT